MPHASSNSQLCTVEAMRQHAKIGYGGGGGGAKSVGAGLPKKYTQARQSCTIVGHHGKFIWLLTGIMHI